jgi:hypothetical protein
MVVKKKKILLILISLLIGGGILALTRNKKPKPKPKRKPATIIIQPTTGGIDAFADYPAGNYFFVKDGAEMWSYPSTIGSDLIKTYQYGGDSVIGLQTGNFNGEVWIEVDDFDNNIGWVKESDLFQKDEHDTIIFGN